MPTDRLRRHADHYADHHPDEHPDDYPTGYCRGGCLIPAIPTPTKRAVRLWLPGRPVPWARTGGAGNQRFLRPEYRTWKTTAVDAAAIQHRGQTIDDRIGVGLRVYPNGINVTVEALEPDDRFRPIGIPGDLDNYTKAALDALQAAAVFTNDRQVEALDVRFVFDPEPK